MNKQFNRRGWFGGVLALCLGFSGAAMAQSIRERVRIAEARIDQGIRSGALTRPEANRLIMEFRQVRDDELRARRNGRIDPYERERLDRELDRLEAHITDLRHNYNSGNDLPPRSHWS